MKRVVAGLALTAAVLFCGAVYAAEAAPRAAPRAADQGGAASPFGSLRTTSGGRSLFFSSRARRQERVKRAIVLEAGAVAGVAVLTWYLVRRRNAFLRIAEQDPADAWFKFYMASQKVCLAGIAVVLAPSMHVDFRLFLRPLVGFGRPLLLDTLDFTLRMAPYLALLGLVSAVSYRVFTQIRGAQITRRDIIAQGLLPTLMWAVPLWFLYLAISAFAEEKPVFAAIFALDVPLSWLVLMGLWWRTFRVRRERLPNCALSENIHKLAEKAGVKLTELQILTPGIRYFSANAFSIQGNSLVLTDCLVEQLTTREVDAVVGHELAHSRRKHPEQKVWLMFLGAGVMIGACTAFSAVLDAIFAVPAPKMPAMTFFCFLCLGILTLISRAISRRNEKKADADAVDLTGDPDALITGLIKTCRLNLWPLQWKKSYELLMPHPSLMRRIEAVARHANITPECLQSLVERGHTGDSQYTIPPSVLENSVIFSSRFRRRIVICAGLVTLALCAIPPVLVALAVSSFDLQGTARNTAYLAGAVLTMAGLVWTFGFWKMAGSPKLGRRLISKLARQGFDVNQWDPVFVDFFPDDSDLTYEGFTNTDVGFVFTAGDRLYFLGDSMKFALDRENFVSAELGRVTGGWSKSRRVVINWRNSESGRFCLTCYVWHVRYAMQANKRLLDMIQVWHRAGRSGEEIPAVLSELGPPENVPADGVTFGISWRSVLASIPGPVLIAGVLCVGLRLFPSADPGPAIYAMGLAALVHVAYHLPYIK